MPNTPYSNIVIESLLNSILETKLNARSLMKIDRDLAEQAGMKKRINKYTYTGTVEEVQAGNGNSVISTIGFAPSDYEVLTYQQRFDVRDEEVMTDPKILDFGLRAMADQMIKKVNDLFFTELATQTNVVQQYTTFSYDTVVDAIGKLAMEDESNLAIVASLSLRDAIRKDNDFVAARQGEIIFNGQIGFIAGIPVIISASVASGDAYVMDREAVTFFLKKDVESETERDADKRTTSYIARIFGLVAMTDATKIVRIKAVEEVTVAAAQVGGTSGTKDTESIALTFNKDVVGLTASDITLTNGTGSAVKGALTGSGKNWSLAISDPAQGNVTVAIADIDGFDFPATATTVAIYAAA